VERRGDRVPDRLGLRADNKLDLPQMMGAAIVKFLYCALGGECQCAC
jgi:hypothetical protein